MCLMEPSEDDVMLTIGSRPKGWENSSVENVKERLESEALKLKSPEKKIVAGNVMSRISLLKIKARKKMAFRKGQSA